MAKKYYAVRNGRVPGIYEAWDDCRRQTEGFSGAVFKSFSARTAAEAFLQGDNVLTPEVQPDNDQPGNGQRKIKQTDSIVMQKPQPDIVPQLGATEAVAYVDGSYDSVSNAFSYGFVLLYQGLEQHFYEKFTDEELAKMHNVAGEIKGSEAAICYCLQNHIRSITIYHDYEGIARWAQGDWKANKPGTVAYAQFCRAAAEKLDIRFVKVKGHSGDKYNDLADKLAKKALGIV